MANYQWGDFSPEYRKASDKGQFYRETVGDIIRRDAEKIAGTESTREKLGLLTKEKVEKAQPFHWKYKESQKHLSTVCADFAQINGSKRPTFDAMLMIERMCKLAPSFNPDLPAGIELDVENGLMTLRKGSVVLIDQQPVLEETTADVTHSAEVADTTGNAGDLRGDLKEEVGGVGNPLDAPEAERGQQFATVTTWSNFREGPSMHTTVKKVLKPDERVQIIDNTTYKSWYLVSVGTPPEQGYIHVSLLKLEPVQDLEPSDDIRDILDPSEIPPDKDGAPSDGFDDFSPLPPVSGEPVPPKSVSPSEVVDGGNEVKETDEIPSWNKGIVLTFDDSLRNAPDIIRRLEQNGITNYRFYGESATAMRTDVLADMGIVGNKQSTKLTPGKWLTEYVDQKRGSMTREEYMREHMIKGPDSRGTDYLTNGENLRTFFQEKYPDNWEAKIGEVFAYHAAFLHPDPTDTKNHIQYWSAEQIQEDIETYETFVRAWLNIPNFKVTHLRAPAGGGFGYDKDWGRGWDTGTGNAQKMVDVVATFRPGATWDNWTVSTDDVEGTVDYRATARAAVDSVGVTPTRPYAPQETSILMHSNYYDPANLWRIDRLARELGDAYTKKHPETKNPLCVEKGATVIVDGAWVRAAPEQGKGGEGRVIAQIPKDERVFIRERVAGMPEWFLVTWGKHSTETGYMHASQLQVDQREKPEVIPAPEAIQSSLAAIPEQQRYQFTQSDRIFIMDTIQGHTLDKTKNQYMVVVDRNRQFAALVYFDSATKDYQIVGDFGSKTSTGKQDVPNKTWATPLGVYDRKGLEEQRVADNKPEWRTEGKGGGGYGPLGSRVFLIGKVDVQSPYGESLSVALHKTSPAGQEQLGEVASSHGCIRVADAFIDTLDKNYLLDGEYGRYVIVGDSSTTRHAGDYHQLPPTAA